MYDMIIIGGGPAGITAAATAINQRLETLIIAERWGGQTTYAMQLEDMEGRETLTGETLLDAFRRQLDYLDFVRRFDTVTKVMPEGQSLVVDTARGDRFEGRTLIVATGARPQRIDVPGEARLAGCCFHPFARFLRNQRRDRRLGGASCQQAATAQATQRREDSSPADLLHVPPP